MISGLFKIASLNIISQRRQHCYSNDCSTISRCDVLCPGTPTDVVHEAIDCPAVVSCSTTGQRCRRTSRNCRQVSLAVRFPSPLSPHWSPTWAKLTLSCPHRACSPHSSWSTRYRQLGSIGRGLSSVDVQKPPPNILVFKFSPPIYQFFPPPPPGAVLAAAPHPPAAQRHGASRSKGFRRRGQHSTTRSAPQAAPGALTACCQPGEDLHLRAVPMYTFPPRRNGSADS